MLLRPAADATAAVGSPILAVDDDEASLRLLERVLEPLGEEVVLAGSGPEAVTALSEREFAVVLLDVAMPRVDGFETAALIKGREETRHVPIVFVSGGIDREQLSRAYAAGAVDYLLKPYEPEILRAKVAVFVDLHRLRKQAEVLTHRALHDPLTGLPNRTLFLDRLEGALARLERTDAGGVAVLFLDLDAFKQVNDTLGHAAGDRVLVEAAARIQNEIRAVDTAARFGGDEFLVLCDGVGGLEEAGRAAARLRDALAVPFSLAGVELDLGVSVGIAFADRPDATPEQLIVAADADMLSQKALTGREGAGRPRAHVRK